MSGNIEARLKKLEMAASTSRLPGMMLLYERDGVLLDMDGKPFVQDIPEHTLLIRYIMPNDDGTPSGRHVSYHEWEALESAAHKLREAANPKPAPALTIRAAEPVLSDYDRRTEEFDRIVEAKRERERRQRAAYWK